MINHIADANKMVGEDVSNEQMTAQATPNEELRRQILSPCVAKSEREWWASRTIEKLEFELNAANQRIKRLEEAGDALKKSRSCGCQNGDSTFYCIACISAWDAWLKAKEDKP